jgi:hypothetical protein
MKPNKLSETINKTIFPIIIFTQQQDGFIKHPFDLSLNQFLQHFHTTSLNKALLGPVGRLALVVST